MVMGRYPPRYKPGFSEHRIPDPYAWIDRVVPWAIIATSIVILVTTFIWRPF